MTDKQNDRSATRRFTVFNELVYRCGQTLTAEMIDKITEALDKEMTSGPTAWAFNPPELLQPTATLPELTEDLRFILGRPNFTCIATAQALRAMGRTIATKAEEEQASTIHWMLGHYLADPANWRQAASDELKAAAAATQSQPE